MIVTTRGLAVVGARDRGRERALADELLELHLGTRADGRVIWPVAGAAPDDGDAGDGDSVGDGGDAGDGGQGQDGDGQGAKGDARKLPEWYEALPTDAKRYITELRRTAQGSSKAAREAQQKLDEVLQAGMTAEQKLRAENATLRKRAEEAEKRDRAKSIKTAFERAGRAANAKSPELMWRLVDQDQVDIDDVTGEVLNADALVAALAKAHPHMFEPRKPAGGADAGARKVPAARAANDAINRALREATGRIIPSS